MLNVLSNMNRLHKIKLILGFFDLILTAKNFYFNQKRFVENIFIRESNEKTLNKELNYFEERADWYYCYCQSYDYYYNCYNLLLLCQYYSNYYCHFCCSYFCLAVVVRFTSYSILFICFIPRVVYL